MSAQDFSGNAPVVLACVLPREPLPEQAEAFLRFSPRIALRARAPWAVFLDLRGIHAPHLELKLAVTLERLGLAGAGPLTGRGPQPSSALIAAAGSPTLTPESPESADSIDWLLDPFGLQDPFPKARRWVELLAALGIRTHADFARLPLPALGSRFGREGVELARRLTESREGASPELWPVFVPPQRIEEGVAFAPDQQIPAAHENLLFVARGLLDRLCLRLKARALRATALEATIELEKNSFTARTPIRAFTLRLSQPQGSVGGILTILQESLRSHIERELTGAIAAQPHVEITVPPNVTSVTIRVTETAPGTSGQRALFDRIDELSENWDSLIGRLQQKLGEQATFFALPTRQHLPEQGWTAARPERIPLPASAPQPVPDGRTPRPASCPATRPSRLLKRTVPLQIDHPTRLLCWPGPRPGARARRLRITAIEGPECLIPPLGQERRYYRIQCAEGPLLWVYSTEEADFEALKSVQLQGYFD